MSEAVGLRDEDGASSAADRATLIRDRHPLWDESTRPTGPQAPEDYVYTRYGRAVGRHLTQVHDHLRSELDQIRELLRQVKEGSLQLGQARATINEMSMRQNNWTLGAYCASYCAIVTTHHSLEDQAVFPHLREADPALAPVIDRLEAEHVVIHEVMQDVDRVLVGLISNPGDFTQVDDAVELLAETLLSHLAYEEREITEPLSRFGFFPGQI